MVEKSCTILDIFNIKKMKGPPINVGLKIEIGQVIKMNLPNKKMGQVKKLEGALHIKICKAYVNLI